MCCLFNISVLHFQLVVEAAVEATVAAAMSDKLKQMDPNMTNICIILCGGNVDIDNLPWYTHG
jgi:serine racemase